VLRERRLVAVHNKDDRRHEEEDEMTVVLNWKRWYTKTKLKEFLQFHALPGLDPKKPNKPPPTVVPILDSLVRIGMATCTFLEAMTEELDHSYHWR
jgi:hypothetical protein